MLIHRDGMPIAQFSTVVGDVPGRLLLLGAARAYYRGDALLQRILNGSHACMGGFLSQSLTAEEKGQLTIDLYSASGASVSSLLTGLWPWEESWYRRRLPRPPARVLVGACGAGREADALVRGGWQVDAFEPAPSLVAASRRRLKGRARVFPARYQDLSAAALDDRDGPAALLAHERYDALVLGWGSLSHLGERVERERLFRALALLCPKGPILASFWLADTSASMATRGPRRSVRLGRTLGQAVRRVRRLPRDPTAGELFTLSGGFGYGIAREEIERLGASIGRVVLWENGSDEMSPVMPHVSCVLA